MTVNAPTDSARPQDTLCLQVTIKKKTEIQLMCYDKSTYHFQ